MSAAIYTAIDEGYRIAGSVLGTRYEVFRPFGVNNPTSPLNVVGRLDAWITADPKLAGTAQSQYGKPVWVGAFSRANTKPGDYLVGTDGTFFIAAQAVPAAPIMLVSCNRTITLSRMPSGFTPGAQTGYDGDTGETAYAAGWPCSLLQLGSGSKMTGGAFKLPSDARAPGCAILLPEIPGIEIRQDDIVTDDLGVRWAVIMTELTDLGWRLTAQEWVA